MRKRLLSIALLGMTVLMLGCGGKTPDGSEAESGNIQQEQGAEGGSAEVHSYLTGLPVTEEVKNRRPLAVMISNIEESLPQSGIGQADIVYEAPVEGRITRLMGIYDDYTSLDKVGSIRSSRDYFVYFAMEYDALYAHFGQATPYVGDLINSDRVSNLSGAVAGIDRPATNTFYRSNDRKAPHNVYLEAEGLLKDMERFDYRTRLQDDYRYKFTFESPDAVQTYPYAEDVTKLYPGGKETNKANGFSKVGAWFEYNEEDGRYYRYQYGGEHIDDLTGEQLAYENVIFQYCHGEVRDENDYLAFGCHGDAEYGVHVFTDGKMIPGIWKRTEDNAPAQYIDFDGNPIVLSPGKTWICIVWAEYAEDVVVE